MICANVVGQRSVGKMTHNAAVANGDQIGDTEPEAALCQGYVAELAQQII